MALLSRKPTSAAEPFRVPSLSEASPAYAELLAKQVALQGKQSDLRTEQRAVEILIRAEPKPEYSPRVAALLDEPVNTDNSPRRRLAEIEREQHDVAAALEVVRQRLNAAKGQASAIVRSQVRPEYSRLVAAMAEALEAVAAARVDYDELIDQFVAEDVEWTGLVPMQMNFLGDRRDGHVQRWLRDAKEAGYAV